MATQTEKETFMISKKNLKLRPKVKTRKNHRNKPQFKKAQQHNRESAKKLNLKLTLMKKLIKS